MVPEDELATPVVPGPTCPDCQAALQSADRHAVSFLLLETLTVPLVGCDEHLEQFRAICGHSTDDSAKLLSHVPAGGIVCPSCRRAHHTPDHPVIQIGDGAIAVLACPTHEEEVIERYQTGLQTRHQLRVDGPYKSTSVRSRE